ncbi:MAG: diaminopimelate epimerase [Melioribacteraceae bacterium]|nr:diaminopimelate epimerase [Melioribacteraceae bacterium]
MKNLLFTKMTGAGNDFILIDKKINPEFEISTDIIIKICDRHFGIGADGVLLFDEDINSSFKLNYYNSDGSTGNLCGNGARCAVNYAYSKKMFDSKKISFLSNNQSYSAEMLAPNIVKFYLNKPQKIKMNFMVKAFNQLIKASFVNTGAPHIVLNCNDILKNPNDLNSKYDSVDDLPVTKLGRELRYHKDFLPDGVNVNFITNDRDNIKIRTYERGVENETLACGTGSVASAIAVFLNNGIKPPIKLIVQSGAELIVDFNYVNNNFENISLTGPAQIVYNGEFII